MAQYHLIVNDHKKQFLDPLILPASEHFPGIMWSDYVAYGISWLSCESDIKQWKDLQKGAYTARFMGQWSGDGVTIYGGKDQEEQLQRIRKEYDNISLEVAAMLFELRAPCVMEVLDSVEAGEAFCLKFIGRVALMEHAPERAVQVLDKRFGPGWRGEVHRYLYGSLA